MNSDNTIQLLNQLYVIHYRSLPIYLGYAKPWALRGDEPAKETLEYIVADQQSTVERIGAMILDLDGEVRPGEFPMRFASYHDLSYDFLIQRMIEQQKKDVASIEDCVSQFRRASMAKALAQECLGAAKAHLDSLVELTGQSSSA